MITPSQCRAARGLLNWSQQQLADAAKVGIVTVRQFENEKAVPRSATMQVIENAFADMSVEFIVDERGEGVVKLLHPARQAATETEMHATADEVRSQAAKAVDDALSDADATDAEKAERRRALTDEPAVIGKARGKGKRV
jgi:transcriptional regulator with XRE-family HTH domain